MGESKDSSQQKPGKADLDNISMERLQKLIAIEISILYLLDPVCGEG